MFIHINKLTLQTTSVRRHDVVIAITSANVFIHPIGVNSIGNFRRLLFNGHQNVARFVVETWFKCYPTQCGSFKCNQSSTFGRIVIADFPDRFTNHLLVVDNSFRGDFSANEDHSGLGGRFYDTQLSSFNLNFNQLKWLTTSNFGIGILFQMSVQNGVTNLIAQLVWNVTNCSKSLTVTRCVSTYLDVLHLQIQR